MSSSYGPAKTAPKGGEKLRSNPMEKKEDMEVDTSGITFAPMDVEKAY